MAAAFRGAQRVHALRLIEQQRGHVGEGGETLQVEAVEAGALGGMERGPVVDREHAERAPIRDDGQHRERGQLRGDLGREQRLVGHAIEHQGLLTLRHARRQRLQPAPESLARRGVAAGHLEPQPAPRIAEPKGAAARLGALLRQPRHQVQRLRQVDRRHRGARQLGQRGAVTRPTPALRGAIVGRDRRLGDRSQPTERHGAFGR